MRFFSCLYIITIIMLMVAGEVKAQFIDEASPPQNVAIAYYKISEKIPNFQQWASYTQEYGTALEESKDAVLAEETVRLERAFSFYDHTTTPVTIRTLVDVEVKEGDKQPKLSISFPKKTASYFPYSFGGEHFALIAENSDILGDIDIGPLEVEQIYKRLEQGGRAVLVLNTVPYKTNTEDTIKSGSLHMQPLLAKIGGISLYNSELETIWAWKAGWYKRVMKGKAARDNKNVIAN